MGEMSFAERYGPWAVIAGGSEGIGSAFADRLARQGINLLLIARKPGPLEEVATECRKRYGVQVRTLSQDLTVPEALPAVQEAAKGCDVGLFIYNAGSDTSFGYFIDRPLEQCEKVLNLNAFAPMRLAHYFAPTMAKRKKGGIILCSSFASLGGMPGNGVYSGAKAFMNNFAEALWYEIGKQGVDVLAVVIPGVKTPAMIRLGAKFDENCSEPEEIADETLANIRKGPILDAGYSKSQAPGMRGLPREQLVRALGAASENYSKG
jgi:short-subunit dehydrogenase